MLLQIRPSANIEKHREPQRKEKDREDIASQLGRQKYVLILRQLNQSQCPHFTAQPLLRTLKYTLADEEGTLHSWRKAFIEMNLHFGRNSLIIAMLIGLISTWYGHNVALRVRSISSFSMVQSGIPLIRNLTQSIVTEKRPFTFSVAFAHA